MIFYWGCRKARRQIVENEILEQDSFLPEHLKKCPPCKDYQDDHEKLAELLPLWKTPEPANDFTEKTLQAFLKQPKQAQVVEFAPRTTTSVWPIALAASILFLVGASFFWKVPQQTTQTVSSNAPVVASIREIGHNDMVDTNRDIRLLGVAYPARHSFTGNPFGKRR